MFQYRGPLCSDTIHTKHAQWQTLGFSAWRRPRTNRIQYKSRHEWTSPAMLQTWYRRAYIYSYKRMTHVTSSSSYVRMKRGRCFKNYSVWSAMSMMVAWPLMYVQCTLYMNIVHCTLYNVHAHEWYIVIRHVRCKHNIRTVPRIQTWTCEQTYKLVLLQRLSQGLV